MEELLLVADAARRMRPDELEDLVRLIAWVASQPESEEEACTRAIEDFARERGVVLTSPVI